MIDANLFLAPGEGGKEPEVEEKPRMPAGVGGAPPTAASLLRGGKYHYVEPGAAPETVQEPAVVTAQEAIAETEPLLVD